MSPIAVETLLQIYSCGPDHRLNAEGVRQLILAGMVKPGEKSLRVADLMQPRCRSLLIEDNGKPFVSYYHRNGWPFTVAEFDLSPVGMNEVMRILDLEQYQIQKVEEAAERAAEEAAAEEAAAEEVTAQRHELMRELLEARNTLHAVTRRAEQAGYRVLFSGGSVILA